MSQYLKKCIMCFNKSLYTRVIFIDIKVSIRMYSSCVYLFLSITNCSSIHVSLFILVAFVMEKEERLNKLVPK